MAAGAGCAAAGEEGAEGTAEDEKEVSRFGDRVLYGIQGISGEKIVEQRTDDP